MGSKTTTHLADENGVSTGEIRVDDTRTLGDARTGTLSFLVGRFDTLIGLGRSFQGNVFQIDATARQNIAMGTLGAPAVWIARDNSEVAMTPEVFAAFAADVSGYYSALVLRQMAFKKAIAAADSVAACDAIEETLDQGWPANG